MTQPLILTLALDRASQSFFERERQRWFPPKLNVIAAHVTLFHHLPGDGLARILADLERLCAEQSPVAFTATGLRFLGRGTAYTLSAPEVSAFRARLAALWHADLTPQDRQGWRPHVTVQNKADPVAARQLHTRLMNDFSPFDGLATGVNVWRYLDGPWESEGSVPFGG